MCPALKADCRTSKIRKIIDGSISSPEVSDNTRAYIVTKGNTENLKAAINKVANRHLTGASISSIALRHANFIEDSGLEFPENLSESLQRQMKVNNVINNQLAKK
ncbi:hypothetical protein ACP275_07G036800 [Erythranthe tilingii]